MRTERKTIAALSSGSLPSGVAIIRISGPSVRCIAERMIGGVPSARNASLRSIMDPETSDVLDQGVTLFFPGPDSFTGEDCLEFQVHGGAAVVASLLKAICAFDDVRMAEAGEFSRRAFENGRMDLTEIEGIADLIASETEAQRKFALHQSMGSLRNLYEGWRKRLIQLRAMIEAELDFAEEEDVPSDISEAGFTQLEGVSREIHNHLADNRAGEIIRDGFRIALMGRPNAGKSSLLNALACRDVAIVTEQAGTTRDVIDVHLDIEGYSVIVSDTAGIREAEDVVEQEGIRRAQARGENADLVVWLRESDEPEAFPPKEFKDVLQLVSKDDDGTWGTNSLSSKTGHGMDLLIQEIALRIKEKVSGAESGLVTRARYREALEASLNHLKLAMRENLDIELRAESLRLASDEIGRITGRIDVEDLLDVIFAEFCVGK